MDTFTFLGIDMTCPLNKAHNEERLGKKALKDKKYARARDHFLEANQLLLEAARVVPQEITSIRLQAKMMESLLQVVDIKQQEDEQRKKNLQNKNDVPLKDGALSSSSDETDGAPSSGNTDGIPWQFVPRDATDWKEKDSLMQFLNFDDEATQHDGRKVAQDPQSRLEELETLNRELKLLCRKLVEELDRKERENRSLGQTVETLRSEVWTLSARLQDIRLDQEETTEAEEENYTEDELQRAFDMHQQAGYDPMVSSIIVQPESFFDFDTKHNLIQNAIDEQNEEDHQLSPIRNPQRSVHVVHSTEIRASPISVGYEDVDEMTGYGCDVVSRLTPSHTRHVGGGNVPCDITTHAGLPPLSPVHFNVELSDSEEES